MYTIAACVVKTDATVLLPRTLLQLRDVPKIGRRDACVCHRKLLSHLVRLQIYNRTTVVGEYSTNILVLA